MSQEQKLEDQFQELDEAVGDAVAEDASDKDRSPPDIRPMLSAKQCLHTRCEVKENAKKDRARLKELKKKNGELNRTVERLTKALKNGVSKDEREDALTKAATDEYVQVLNQENRKLLLTVEEAKNQAKKALAMVNRLQAERSEYEGLIQTDDKLAEKWKQLRLTEERCAQMDAWYKDAHQKAQKMHSDIEKQRLDLLSLRRQRDETRAEYENAKKLLRHADELLQKGFKVEAPKKPFFNNPFKK